MPLGYDSVEKLPSVEMIGVGMIGPLGSELPLEPRAL